MAWGSVETCQAKRRSVLACIPVLTMSGWISSTRTFRWPATASCYRTAIASWDCANHETHPGECTRSRWRSAAAVAASSVLWRRHWAGLWSCCRTALCGLWRRRKRGCGQYSRVPMTKWGSTYREASDFSPENASWATREMLLLDKSIRRNRRWFAKAFGGSSVMKFCSKRLIRGEKEELLIPGV